MSVDASNGKPPVEFSGRERDYIEALQRRLGYLRDSPDYVKTNSYARVEANALGWVLDFLGATVEPVDIRIERMERRLRKVETSVGRMRAELDDEDES